MLFCLLIVKIEHTNVKVGKVLTDRQHLLSTRNELLYLTFKFKTRIVCVWGVMT